MKRTHMWAGLVLAGIAAAVTFGVVGCDALTGGGSRVTELPAELVLWGDPDPENDKMFLTVRDVNDLDYRHVQIGTGGEVQFNIGKVCTNCDVEESTILINGAPTMHIRFGTGPKGVGERRPFLVSTNGFYIELVTVGDAISFQREDERFEEDDDLSDDLAERVGTILNTVAGS